MPFACRLAGGPFTGFCCIMGGLVMGGWMDGAGWNCCCCWEEMRNYLLEEVLLQVRAGIVVVVGEAMRNYLLEEVLLQVRAGIAVVVGEAMRNYLLEEEMRNYLLEEAV